MAASKLRSSAVAGRQNRVKRLCVSEGHGKRYAVAGRQNRVKRLCVSEGHGKRYAVAGRQNRVKRLCVSEGHGKRYAVAGRQNRVKRLCVSEGHGKRYAVAGRQNRVKRLCVSEGHGKRYAVAGRQNRVKRLAVLISGRGSNMRSILEAIKDKRINAVCCAVVSSRADAEGLEIARQFGAPRRVVNVKGYQSNQAFNAALFAVLREVGAELIALAGFMHRLESDLVKRYAGRMLNIHPSLLPDHKGLHTHERALKEGRGRHGCSVHFVNEKLDDGAVIMQASVAVREDDTAKKLAQRVLRYEHLIYPQSLALLCAGRLSLKGKRGLLDGRVLHEPLLPYGRAAN